MRRHHLIEEAKTELDVAYEEVKRAESKVMGLEQEYNDKTKTVAQANGSECEALIQDLMAEKESIQASFHLEQLYELQGSAVERFGITSSAFAIIGSVEDHAIGVDLMRNILFRKDEIGQEKIEIDRALRNFSLGLRGYMREAASADNDAMVRQSWSKIEELLRRFGRNI